MSLGACLKKNHLLNVGACL